MTAICCAQACADGLGPCCWPRSVDEGLGGWVASWRHRCPCSVQAAAGRELSPSGWGVSGWQPAAGSSLQPPQRWGQGLATLVTAGLGWGSQGPCKPCPPILEPPGHLPRDIGAAPCFTPGVLSPLFPLSFSGSEGTQRRGTGPALKELPDPHSVPSAALGRAGGRAPAPSIRPRQSGKTAWRKWPALLRQPESSCAREGRVAVLESTTSGLGSWPSRKAALHPVFPPTVCRPALLCFKAPGWHRGGDDAAKLAELDSCEGSVGQLTPRARHPTALAF